MEKAKSSCKDSGKELVPTTNSSSSAAAAKTSNTMTETSGICDINPSHVISDFEFESCGYSANRIDGVAYSTVRGIHLCQLRGNGGGPHHPPPQHCDRQGALLLRPS